MSAAEAQDAPTILGPQESTVEPRAPVQPKALSDQDQAALRQGLEAAKAGDIGRASELQAGIADPVARKLVLWAMADSAPERLSFFELDQSRKDLWGWPRASRRQTAAEMQLDTQGMAPASVIDWFKGKEPVSPEGAMALAGAYRAAGQTDQAQTLIRHFWRDKVFEAEPQQQMLARFGDFLSVDDHVHRADMLLYGQQGPAAHDMIDLLPPDQRQLAEVRMAYRNNSSKAGVMVEALPPSLQDSPGLTFELARYMRKQRQGALALPLIRRMPTDPPGDEAGGAIWAERRALIGVALSARDYRAAYQAAAENGLQPGPDFAEAEFFAGWIALTKLNDPALADKHFGRIELIGSSPITQGRALYWRGRAAEAAGDPIGARDLYAQAAQYTTTFYGQLAAERAGQDEIALGHDPVPSSADRSRFEGREMVQAARFLADAGEKDLFRTFVLTLDDALPNAEEYVLLVDMARSYGDLDLSMRVARVAAQHGFVLPDRAYPMVSTGTPEPGSAEPALVYGITRQESNFDPRARSGPGARGMMQLMPATASHVARRLGVGYSISRLEDPDYNIRIGSAYLGGMIDSFGGSYVMATASYDAGPNHMAEWASICGDPRTSANDPLDFIECIPFTETRNYVMRVLETMEVYRAKLNGGKARLTLSQDLKRGAYASGSAPLMAQSGTPASPEGVGTMAPIPD